MELFGVYEKMRRVLEREGFTPTSDIFERELSLYTGNTDEIIYQTERSYRSLIGSFVECVKKRQETVRNAPVLPRSVPFSRS